MKWYNVTPITWRRILFSVGIVIFAAAIRVWPLQILETRVTWLTFYPAVMVASIYGGLLAGLLTTSLACVTIVFFWQLISANPYITQSADWLSLIFFFAVCIMISVVSESMRRANLRAKEAQTKAQMANEAKSTFLANMSHELRTPLNAILGYSQLMQRDPLLSQQSRNYLDTINRSGEHLLSLINDVLDIAKIESKKAVLNLAPFNFRELITDIRKMFIINTNAKNLTFDVSGVESVPPVLLGDSTKFRMVLINLLGNAVKFTNSGGIQISFDGQKTAAGLWLISVSVTDTGIGISQNEKEKLFKFFYQTESGRLSNSGTGLGLAISQEYVKMMGGKIMVDSHVGTGSTFSFAVQMQEPDQIAAASSTGKQRVIGLAPGQKPPCILIAEDMAENRQLLVKMLGVITTRVYEASNGAEAVQLFEAYQPDLIWMDIRMPVMDGLEATRTIRTKNSGIDTKIIALSAHVFADEKDAISAAGCNGFVAKPFRENEIYQMMAEQLKLIYTYETERVDSTEEVVDLAALAAHPGKSLQQSMLRLHDAVIVLDTDKINEAIAAIAAEDADLAEKLKKVANNLDYSALLKFTESRPKDA